MMISAYPILSALLNICINLRYWPLHLKKSTSIIISKLNKATYDLSKMFQPIVLFNILGKLIKKVIGERLQTSIHYIKSYLSQSARWIEAELDY